MSDEMQALIVEDNQKLRKENYELKQLIDKVFTYFDHSDNLNWIQGPNKGTISYPWCGIKIYKHAHPEDYQYFINKYNEWCISKGLEEWQIR